jgi:hypothetical protein
MARVSMRRLLVISLLVAICGFVAAMYGLHSRGSTLADVGIVMLWTYGPAALWLVLFIVGLIVHGKRGLWLLVGAPFALLLPALYSPLLYFFMVCAFGRLCI